MLCLAPSSEGNILCKLSRRCKFGDSEFYCIILIQIILGVIRQLTGNWVYVQLEVGLWPVGTRFIIASKFHRWGLPYLSVGTIRLDLNSAVYHCISGHNPIWAGLVQLTYRIAGWGRTKSPAIFSTDPTWLLGGI